LLRLQEAFSGLFDNLPGRLIGFVMRQLIFCHGLECKAPSDALGQQVVRTLMAPGPARERLTAGTYISPSEHDAVGGLEAALVAVIAAEAVEAKMRAAQKAGVLQGKGTSLTDSALRQGIISASDAQVLARAQQLRRRAIMVDDFPRDLGKTEIFQTTQAVSFEALGR